LDRSECTREHLGAPTDLKPEATQDTSAALSGLLADVFALCLKTKNFHRHISSRHFRHYHLLLGDPPRSLNNRRLVQFVHEREVLDEVRAGNRASH
jgi:hypothetical protein